MAQDTRSTLFMGSLIGSGVGYLLLILTEFGGWYNYNGYLGVRTWGSIGPWGVGGFLVMAVLGLPLLFCAIVSLKGASNPDSVPARFVQLAFLLAILEFVVVFLGAVAFIVSVLDSTQWWFSSGFYGAFIGGLLAVLSLAMVRKQYRTAPAAPGWAAPMESPASNPVQPEPTMAPPAQLAASATPASSPGPAVAPAAFCSRCGAAVSAGARFCMACGSAVQ